MEHALFSPKINDVLSNFPIIINQWCEDQHRITGRPRTEMCKKAVQVFNPPLSPSYIRQQIEPRYKIVYRVNNGKKARLEGKTTRIRQKITNLEESLKEAMVDATHRMKKG